MAPKTRWTLAALALAAVLAALLVSTRERDQGPAPESGDRAEGGPAPVPEWLGEKHDEARAKPVGLIYQVFSADAETPVPGARIDLFRDDGEEPVATATTDADGFARFTGLLDEEIRAWIRAEGFAPVFTDGEIPMEDPEADAVSLRAPRPLSGRVVDALTGDAIANALLIAYRGSTAYKLDRTHVRRGPESSTSRSAADGAFTIPDRQSHLVVGADGYATVRKILHRRIQEMGELVIRLVPTGCVEGRVLSPKGEPVSGAEVTAAPFAGGADLLSRRAEWRLRHRPRDRAVRPLVEDAFAADRVLTDANGNYRLPLLAAGEPYRLRAMAHGFAPSRILETVRLGAGETRNIDFSLELGATLRLTVVRRDGLPARSPELTLETATLLSKVGEFKGDENGLLVVEGLAPGKYHGALESSFCHAAPIEVELADGQTLERTVELYPTSPEDPDEIVTIRGRVIDENDAPVEGATVTCTHADPEELVTGTDGRFSFRKKRRIYPDLDVRARGFFYGSGSGRELNDEEAVIRILRKSRIRIPLALPPGAVEPERLSLRLRHPDHNEGLDTYWKDLVPDGVFTLEVRSDVSRLILRAKGYGVVAIPLSVRPGEDRMLPQVDLIPGIVLALQLTTEAGKPVPGISVWCGEVASRADAKGVVRFDGMTPGEEVRIRSYARGFEALKRTVTVPASLEPVPLELIAIKKDRLTGIVLDREGYPVSFARVDASRIVTGEDPEFVDWADTDNAGRFELAAPAGRYLLDIEPPRPEYSDRGTQRREVEFTADDGRLFTFRITR